MTVKSTLSKATVTNTNLVSVTYSLEKPHNTSSPHVSASISSGLCTITYTVSVVPVPVTTPALVGGGKDASTPYSTALPNTKDEIPPSNPSPLTTYGVSCDKDKGCKTVTIVVPPFTKIGESPTKGGATTPVDSVPTTTPIATAFPVVACDEDKGCTTITVTIPSTNTITLEAVGSTKPFKSAPTSAGILPPSILPVIACDKDKECLTSSITVPIVDTATLTGLNPGKPTPFVSKPESIGSEQSGATQVQVTTFPGYQVVPSPSGRATTSISDSSSTTSPSVIPVWTAAMLGNAYGGGFITTPSIFVTAIPSASAPEIGIPPGYGVLSNDDKAATTAISQTRSSIGAPITPPAEAPISASIQRYVESTIVETIVSSNTVFVISTKFPAGLPIGSGVPVGGVASPASATVQVATPSSVVSSPPSTSIYLVGVTPVSGGEVQVVYSSAVVSPTSDSSRSPAAGVSVQGEALRASSALSIISNGQNAQAIPNTASAQLPASEITNDVNTQPTFGPVPASLIQSNAVSEGAPSFSSFSYAVGIIASSAGSPPTTYAIPPYNPGSTSVALPPVEVSGSIASPNAVKQSLYKALTSALALSLPNGGVSAQATNAEISEVPAASSLSPLTPIPSGVASTGGPSSNNGSLLLPLGPTALPVYQGNATAVSVSISLWLVVLAVAVMCL